MGEVPPQGAERALSVTADAVPALPEEEPRRPAGAKLLIDKSILYFSFFTFVKIIANTTANTPPESLPTIMAGSSSGANPAAKPR